MGDMTGYTTIAIDKDVKRVLDVLRKNGDKMDSYNDTIKRLLSFAFLKQEFEFVGVENNALRYRTNKSPEEVMETLMEIEKLGYMCNIEVSDAVYVELSPK